MKKIVNVVTTLLVMSVMIQLTSCGGKDPEPAQQEIVAKQLTSGTWTLQGTTVDGVDQTAVYQGLTLSFSATSYTTTKGGLVWPASGTWSFTDDTAATIKREDGTEVKVEATDTTLKLTLTWTKTTLGAGRIESVKGVNVFVFKK